MSLAGLRSGSRAPAAPQDGERAFDSLDFRRAMGCFATGVTVVTMLGEDDEVFGLTVNAFMSVSLEPPLIAVSVGKAARAHPTLAASERFAVSVLGEGQGAVSDRFAGRRPAEGSDSFTSLAGFPVVEGAVAHVVCRMHSSMEAGDHTIFVGEVEALSSEPGEPLLFHGGRYCVVEDGAAKTS